MPRQLVGIIARVGSGLYAKKNGGGGGSGFGPPSSSSGTASKKASRGGKSGRRGGNDIVSVLNDDDDDASSRRGKGGNEKKFSRTFVKADQDRLLNDLAAKSARTIIGRAVAKSPEYGTPNMDPF